MTDGVPTFTAGDRVSIFFAGEEVHGAVVLASTNGGSLMLSFDGILGGYVGLMPVLRDDEGVYEDLIERRPVAIKPIAAPWPGRDDHSEPFRR